MNYKGGGMNYKVIRDIFVRIWKGPYIRMAFVASVALTLLAASLALIGQSSAAGAAAEIRATGTFTSAFGPNIATQTSGNLDILSRYNLITFRGSLEGGGLSLQTITRDDVVAKKAWLTNIGTFFGSLDGSEPGSFSFITHAVTDRTACVRDVACPSSLTPTHGKVIVIAGTGQDGLAGICGGGTFDRPRGEPATSSYDFTFRFGKDCKANN